jgi:hypothetical protein
MKTITGISGLSMGVHQSPPTQHNKTTDNATSPSSAMGSESFWRDFRALFNGSPQRSGPSVRRDDALARDPETSLPPSSHSTLFTLFTVSGFLASVASAQTWQTVDDFQYLAGAAAENFGLAVAPSGIVYACGWAADGMTRHGLVMATTDGGDTWSAPLDDFVYSGLATMDDGGITADSVGDLYVAGHYYGSPQHQFVRRSTDGGCSWQTVDDVVVGTSSSFPSGARGITADTSGNVYVAGRAYNTWSIRKGTGGTSYATVDTFQPGSSQAWAVFAHPTAGTFAVGYGTLVSKNSSSAAWVVRRSLDGGATWATADTYQASSGYGAEARGIGADAQGNLYVVGFASVPNKGSRINHWQVRKSANGGTSWSTVDDFAPLANQTAVGFAEDGNGNLFVAGWTSAGTGSSWVVRESLGGTSAWTTVDSFSNAMPHAIAAGGAGNVFVGGQGSPASGAVHWVVRKN